MTSYRNLFYRRFGERYTYGIANSFPQQRCYAHTRFNSACIAVSGFSNAKVKREHELALFHEFDQLTVSLYHDNGIGCLERDYHVEKRSISAHVQPLHSRLCHGIGRIAVKLCDVFTQRAMIETYPDSRSVGFAHLQEFCELAPRFLVVGMKIAGIDTHLFNHLGAGDRSIGREMNISYKRDTASLPAENGMNLPDGRDILQAWHRDTYHPGTGCGKFKALGHSGLYVGCVSVAHRLHHHRRSAADYHIVTYLDLQCCQSFHTQYLWLVS